MYVSPIESTGISIGKPPACQTPRFTSSARVRKCAWQVLASLQVLRIAITGLPLKSSVLKPSCLVRERCVNGRTPSAQNQRWLRSSSGVLRRLCAHARIIQDARLPARRLAPD